MSPEFAFKGDSATAGGHWQSQQAFLRARERQSEDGDTDQRSGPAGESCSFPLLLGSLIPPAAGFYFSSPFPKFPWSFTVIHFYITATDHNKLGKGKEEINARMWLEQWNLVSRSLTHAGVQMLWAPLPNCFLKNRSLSCG